MTDLLTDIADKPVLGRAREVIHALERYEALHLKIEPCLERVRLAAFEAIGVDPLPAVHPSAN